MNDDAWSLLESTLRLLDSAEINLARLQKADHYDLSPAEFRALDTAGSKLGELMSSIADL